MSGSAGGQAAPADNSPLMQALQSGLSQQHAQPTQQLGPNAYRQGDTVNLTGPDMDPSMTRQLTGRDMDPGMTMKLPSDKAATKADVLQQLLRSLGATGSQ